MEGIEVLIKIAFTCKICLIRSVIKVNYLDIPIKNLKRTILQKSRLNREHPRLFVGICDAI